MFNKKKRVATINKIANESQESKVIKKLNSLLSRKDIVNLNNEKVDALRMLTFHLESNKELTSAQLVRFLKN